MPATPQHHALLEKVTASGSHRLYLVRPSAQELEKRLEWYRIGGWIVLQRWEK